MFARLRRQSKLRLHEFRHVRLGFSFRFQAHDPRLLGELVPAGPAFGRTMAHVVLHCHHFPGFFLSSELDLGHRSHVVRRVAEEGGGRRVG